MSITIVGTPQSGNVGAGGGDVTLTFDVTPATGDYVVVAGGHSSSLTSITAPGASATNDGSYTQIFLNSGSSPECGVWIKKMGATPDTQVVCPGGDVNDVAAYTSYVLTGVDGTTPQDATATSASGTSTNPNPPSITTVTDGAWVIGIGLGASNDSSPGTILGYSNQVKSNRGASIYVTTVSMMTLEKTSHGAENPAAYSSWSNGAWYAVTVALRPAAGGATTINLAKGAFSWAGTTGNFSKLLNIGLGTYAWTGKSANIAAIPINLTPGSYAWSGLHSNLATNINLTTATYAWSGKNGNLSSTINLGLGGFTWSGKAVTFTTVTTINTRNDPYLWQGARNNPGIIQKNINLNKGAWSWAGTHLNVGLPAMVLTKGSYSWSGKTSKPVTSFNLKVATYLWQGARNNPGIIQVNYSLPKGAWTWIGKSLTLGTSVVTEGGDGVFGQMESYGYSLAGEIESKGFSISGTIDKEGASLFCPIDSKGYSKIGAIDQYGYSLDGSFQ